jgi:hypothetical protein
MRVRITSYSEYIDPKTRVRFEPVKVTLPEGGIVLQGAAEIDDADLLRHYATHPSGVFVVDGQVPALASGEAEPVAEPTKKRK